MIVTITIETSALDKALRTLRLSGMLATIEARLAQARAGELGHIDFVQVLCEGECGRSDCRWPAPHAAGTVGGPQFLRRSSQRFHAGLPAGVASGSCPADVGGGIIRKSTEGWVRLAQG